MDHATREFSLVFRRLLGALLGITLLVAFWADRPLAAESYPAAERAAAASPPPAGAEPPPTSLVSWARRPWLAFYTLAGAPHACLELLYADDAKLFLPVENIDLLSRYGGEGTDAILDKLGGVAWQARKAKLKKRLLDANQKKMDIMLDAMDKAMKILGKDKDPVQFERMFRDLDKLHADNH